MTKKAATTHRRRQRALLVAALAFACAPRARAAEAKGPNVSVELTDCDPSFASEVRRIAGVELRAVVVDPSDPAITRARVTCHDDAADLWVSDSATSKIVFRSVSLSRTSARARARLIALAVAELVSASWEEVESNPEPAVPAVTPPPPEMRAIVRRAIEGPERMSLDGLADGRAFFGSGLFLLGGAPRASVRLASALTLRIDAAANGGNASRTLDDVSVQTMQGSLGLGWAVDLRTVGMLLWLGAGAGYAWLRGEPSGAEDAQPVAGQNWTSYNEYYFTSGDLGKHTNDSTPPAPAFEILQAAAGGTQPLMALFYSPNQNHTELAVGKERYTRALNQGQGPLWHLEWSGITQPTTLVVEALASGCPYQGFLSPQHRDVQDPHQAFFTLDEMQKASSTGEVFINGQYDLPNAVPGGLALLRTPDASPIPIARSFIQVTPQPPNPSDWDWYQGFSVETNFPASTESSDPKFANDQASIHYTSSLFDIGGYSLDGPSSNLVFSYGQFLGQFWEAFDDMGQDVTGSVRFTANQKSSVATDSSKFLHVTWSVDIVGTDRRYPQLIMTDQNAPIEDGLSNANANFLLIQTINGPSMRLEVQAFHGLVNGNPWAVNNQAQEHRLIDYDDWNGGTNSNGEIPPAQPIFELAGMDQMAKFDAYISNQQVYVLVNGRPAGCTKYPNSYALSGAVTVTFGDVLYHEGAADEGVCSSQRPYAFMHEHQCTETKRHWDDLGFKAGVAAPAWDATNFPCAAY